MSGESRLWDARMKEGLREYSPDKTLKITFEYNYIQIDKKRMYLDEILSIINSLSKYLLSVKLVTDCLEVLCRS